MKPKLNSLIALAALTAAAFTASAQEPNKPTSSEPRERDGRRGGNDRGGGFEEMRQRMNERLKTSLKVTDEEWTVLQPLIEKVSEKQREAMGSRFGGPGGPGGTRGPRPDGGNPSTAGAPVPQPSGDQAPRPERPGSAESQALRTALENESTSPEDLKAKLTALREVRKKGTNELNAAREDLRKVVTVRQEAVLVSMGILE